MEAVSNQNSPTIAALSCLGEYPLTNDAAALSLSINMMIGGITDLAMYRGRMEQLRARAGPYRRLSEAIGPQVGLKQARKCTQDKNQSDIIGSNETAPRRR